MIVVDTNVIAYLWIPGHFTPLAQNALGRDPDWLAPFLWRSEFRNVLAVYVRQGLVTHEVAMRVVASAERQMHGHEYTVCSEEVLDLARSSGCSAYDCEFAALATRLRVPLVTTDKRLLAAFPATSVPLEEFVAE